MQEYPFHVVVSMAVAMVPRGRCRPGGTGIYMSTSMIMISMSMIMMSMLMISMLMMAMILMAMLMLMGVFVSLNLSVIVYVDFPMLVFTFLSTMRMTVMIFTVTAAMRMTVTVFGVAVAVAMRFRL